MTSLTVTAPAKLNLCLHVLGKRIDGYHNLESLVAFTEFGDTLEFSKSDILTLKVQGPYADALAHSDDQNLVMKAASMLRLRSGCNEGARIVLHKKLPIGAGLGGGSSDAASTLLGLYRFWHIDYDHEDANAYLMPIATKLGSDVPVCLRRQAAWMRGAGEQVTPLSGFPDVAVVLLNPKHELLTADVYKKFSSAFASSGAMPKQFGGMSDLISFLQTKRNDLQPPAVALLPEINNVLAALNATRGCKFARMSGSGPTCFGLYATLDEAQHAAAALQHTYHHWWCEATRLVDWNKHGQA